MSSPNLFAQAIESFIDDLQTERDQRSSFYSQLLTEAAKLRSQNGTHEQSARSTQALQSYIEDLDKRQTKCGKTRFVGRKLQPLLTGLTQFTHAMDTMIQAGPAPALLIYGGAKLVLRLAEDFANCFDKMVDTMHEIGTRLECYHIFSKTYCSDDGMRHVLVRSYKNVLSFWRSAFKLFTRNGVKTLLKGVVKPFDAEWRMLEKNLNRDVAEVSVFAQALQGRTIKRLEEEVDRHATKMERRFEQEQRQRIRSWLSGPDDIAQTDVRMDLERIESARHIGTCEWVLRDPEYQHWLTSPTNANLWLHANPGTGKSVLCSTIIRKLQSENRKVVYFFCSFQEPLKRRITRALGSIALQLLALHKDIPTNVKVIFDQEITHGYLKLQNPDVLLLVLQVLLNSLDRVYVVLDGLDECEDSKITTDLLSNCFAMSGLGITKWLWASRIDPDFQSLSSSAKSRSIYVQKTHVEADIKKFIEDSPEMAGNSDESVNTWLSASEGNFLWLTLMLRTLTGCDLTCPAEVEEELDRIPKGLAQCYQRVLDQLTKKSKEQQELARKLFLLVAFAEQPLTLHETIDALSIDEKSGTVSPKRRPWENTVKRLCCPLILADPVVKNGRHDFVLRYFHKSTRDFFLENQTDLDMSDASRTFLVTPKQGHLSMSGMCMTYLSHERYRNPMLIDPKDDKFVEDHGFMQYAALFWHRHFSYAGHCDHLSKAANDFLRSPNFWSCMRVQATIAPYLFGRLVSEGDDFTMIKPNHIDTTYEDYFATPLPDWLGVSEQGLIAVEAYLAFVTEWNRVLLLQPQAILHCHPGILGDQNIFSIEGVESLNYLTMDVKSMNSSSPLCNASSSRLALAPVIGAQLARSRLRLFSLEKPQEVESDKFIVRRWHVNFDGRRAKDGAEIKQKQAWDINTPIKQAFLQLHTEEKVHEPAVWSLDIDALNLSAHRAGKDVQYIAPPEISQFKSEMSHRLLYSNLKLHSVRQQRHQHAHKLVISVLWILGPQTTGSETNDDSDSSDDSDSDLSDSDDDFDQSSSSSLSGHPCQSKEHVCFGIVIAIEGVNEPVWSSWQSVSGPISEFVPAVHPQTSLLVWPIDKSSVQYASFMSRTSQQLSLPFYSAAVGNEILLRDLKFAKCGTTLYCLTVTSTKEPEAKRTVYRISLENFALKVNDVCILEQVEPKSTSTLVSVTYTAYTTVDTAVILRKWTDDWVYLAVNSSSSPCTIKVLRLPLSISQPEGPCSAQTLPSTFYVPASFATRSPIFEIAHMDTEEHIAFVLQPSTTRCNKDSGIQQLQDSFAGLSIEAGTPSAASPPSPSLTPIVITRKVMHPGGWRSWSPERDGEELNTGNRNDMMGYMKGSYATADQRFSVPIRSGLDCRQAITVSCW